MTPEFSGVMKKSKIGLSLIHPETSEQINSPVPPDAHSIICSDQTSWKSKVIPNHLTGSDLVASLLNEKIIH